MLASPAEDAAEIIAPARARGLGRGQVRRHPRPAPQAGREVRLYSRDLHDVSGQFPEVVDAARATRLGRHPRRRDPRPGRTATVLPFVALQARLGRKAPSAAIQAEVPVIYVAFDALALGPGGGAPVEPLLRAPLAERRAAPRRARPAARRRPAGGSRGRTWSVAADADALEAAFTDARARRNEGLMVKDPASGYSPGRRGLGWLKMKKALATIDCVVVGVEVGHGKRHGVLSDYTFAVRDDRRTTGWSTSARPTAA